MINYTNNSVRYRFTAVLHTSSLSSLVIDGIAMALLECKGLLRKIYYTYDPT